MKNKGKKTEFKMEIKNQTETSADLFLYGEIVGSEWDRWTEEDMAPETFRHLLEQANGRDLNIYINSGGGSVFGGLSIANSIKRYSGKTRSYVDGLAGSISSIIALSTDETYIPANAFLMIHKPLVGVYGNATELRKMAGTLDRIEEGLLSVYEENLKDGVDMATIKTMVAKETWLSGKDAINYFNVQLLEPLEAVATLKGTFFNSYENAPSDIIESEDMTEDIQSPLEDTNTPNENEVPNTSNLEDENVLQVSDKDKNLEIQSLLLEIDLI